MFASAQPTYAALGIVTFPVSRDKRPAVRGYSTMGFRESADLCGKFGRSPAFGFMCGKRSGLTVLDIDSTDERVLAAALAHHGQTPIVVRTASGKWHAYYRHNNERRCIRPWAHLPIDLLGTGGYVIAPTSATRAGRYEFVKGSLDDLEQLPTMRGLDASHYDATFTDETRSPTMGRVIDFPGGNGKRDPADIVCGTPFVNNERNTEWELAQVYLETAQLQRDQLKAEFKRAQFLWLWFCIRRAAFWGVVLWLLSRFV